MTDDDATFEAAFARYSTFEQTRGLSHSLSNRIKEPLQNGRGGDVVAAIQDEDSVEWADRLHKRARSGQTPTP